MLQSLLVTALRHRAFTDPASVIKEIEAMMKVTNGQPCAARSKLSVSEGHQLKTLHGDLFFECTSGGSGPVTRSRKRAPVGISYLESPPMVTVPPSVAVRNAWRSVGVNVDPIPPPPQGSAAAIPPPSGAWPGVCNDDDDIDPPPDLPTRRQKRPRAAQIAPPEPRAPAEAASDIPPPARNVPAAAAAQPVRIDYAWTTVRDTLQPGDFESLRVEADKFIDVAAFSVPGAKGKTTKINDGSYRSKPACQYAHCKDCALPCTFKLRLLHVTHNNGDDIDPRILVQTNVNTQAGMSDAGKRKRKRALINIGAPQTHLKPSQLVSNWVNDASIARNSVKRARFQRNDQTRMLSSTRICLAIRQKS